VGWWVGGRDRAFDFSAKLDRSQAAYYALFLDEMGGNLIPNERKKQSRKMTY
jgi:hypothetical protein